MKQNSITLPSFAKINLFLHVLGKRTDGFHELFTAFQTVSLCDKLTFTPSDSLNLTCSDATMPTDEKNLIIKAAQLLQKMANVNRGARIHLEKHIPYPGGLGGGSSNAAVTLLGLATLWNLKTNNSELLSIASEIGSDVPFFLVGGTAIGRGRGTEILEVSNFSQKYMIIVTPSIDVPTAQAYSNLSAEDLTNIDSKSILKICREAEDKLQTGNLMFVNDFENSVFEIKPEIKLIKEKLFEVGAKQALLSGSGASIFAIFDNEKKRQVAFDELKSENNLRKFAVSTISRQDYQNFYQPCKHLLPNSL
jgi:4-diphosphocytidyl-2-C-methyl-D-erythritol kinase